jgi:hypothetical protein
MESSIEKEPLTIGTALARLELERKFRGHLKNVADTRVDTTFVNRLQLVVSCA